MEKTAPRKSRYLPKSTAGAFAIIATDSAQSLTKKRLAKDPCEGTFENAVFHVGFLPSGARGL
jgi:hypothetical protein